MIKYIIRRILLMIPVLLGVSILVFVLQALTPGDPADIALGPDASEASRTEWRAQYDLDKPLPVQYAKYMYRLITKGDFGVSLRTGTSINEELAKRFPISLKMAVLAIIVACCIGIPLGILSAKYRGTWIDSIIRAIGIGGISLPMFWLAFLVVMQFSVEWKLLPVSGLYSWKHWILPAFTIGFVSSASILRITRSSVLDSISADFVRTARAKGQSEGVIMKRHILKNSLIPISTTVATQFGSAIGSSAVVETVFVITGMGISMVSAINNRDYTLLRACVLLTAVSVSVINLLCDIVYSLIDPRVKARFSNSGVKKGVKAAKKKAEGGAMNG